MRRICSRCALLMIILALMVIILPGCGETAGPTTPSGEWQWPSELDVMCMNINSTTFAFFSGVAPIMEKSIGISVKPVPVESTVNQPQLMAAGEFDFCQVPVTATPTWLAGQAGFVVGDIYDIRVIWVVNPSCWSWMVSGNSELKTIYDIKEFAEAGKEVRVAVHHGSPAHTAIAEKGLPDFLDMDPELLTFVPFPTWGVFARSVLEGKADVAWCSGTDKNAIEMEAMPQGLRWLDMPLEDKEGWSRFLNSHRVATPGVIEFGPDSIIGVEGCYTWFVYGTRATEDEELVYHLAKWFNENYDLYKDVTAQAQYSNLGYFKKFLAYSPLPIHDGTIRYLREIGEWTDADDVWNAENTRVIEAYVDSWNKAKEEAEEKGIEIAVDNEEWKSLRAKYSQGLPVYQSRIK